MAHVCIGVNQSFGRRKVDRETWAEKHNLGNKAFNDALLVERGVFVLLKHYFGDEASIYYDAVTHAQRVRTLGKSPLSLVKILFVKTDGLSFFFDPVVSK